MEPDRASFYALVVGGLEPLVSSSIETTLGLAAGSVEPVGVPPPSDWWATGSAARSVWPGAAGCGKLAFSVPRPRDAAGWQELSDRIAAIPCVQCLLAPIAVATVSLERDGLAQIGVAIGASERWDEALATWRGLLPDRATEVPSFRGSAVRDGRHAYDSTAVGMHVGEAVGSRFPEWRVDLTGFTLEVVALVLQSSAVIGITLSSGLKFKNSMASPEPYPLLPHRDICGRMRSSTAWLCVALAAPQPGDVLLDPMCGVGTIPLEAAAARESLVTLAGDVDAHSLAQAAANGRALERARLAAAAGKLAALPLGADGAIPEWVARERRYAKRAAGSGLLPAVWSAEGLPLRTACVDVIVVDLPFGNLHKANINKFYPSALREMARVLRPGTGRLVTLSPSVRCMTLCLERQRELWEPLEQLAVNCGGGLCVLCLWRRTEQPAPAPQSDASCRLNQLRKARGLPSPPPLKEAAKREAAAGEREAARPAPRDYQIFRTPAEFQRAEQLRAGARLETGPPPPPKDWLRALLSCDWCEAARRVVAL